MDSWTHDGFLDSRWILAFMMSAWIHDGFLDSRGVLGFTMGSWIPDWWNRSLHDGGTALSAYANRYPFFTVRTLVGEKDASAKTYTNERNTQRCLQKGTYMFL